MKRSSISAGALSIARGSTFSGSPSGGRTPKRRATFTPASKAQKLKVRTQVCAVCHGEPVDPAHLTPRSFRGCESPDCVIGLCREHHRSFDDGTLDLLPYIAGRGFGRELAHMQAHYDDPLSVIFRLSGHRWIPESEAA